MRVSPRTGKFIAPDSSTIRRTLNAIDRSAFDKIVGSWLAEQVSAKRLGQSRDDENSASKAVARST
jgi:hypothetical protein